MWTRHGSTRDYVVVKGSTSSSISSNWRPCCQNIHSRCSYIGLKSEDKVVAFSSSNAFPMEKLQKVQVCTLIISGEITFGSIDENIAISGAGLAGKTVIVCHVFLQLCSFFLTYQGTW